MDRVTAAMLLDYYGDLLTDKQRALFDSYYNQDLSFSEIAQLEGVSRQAVRDAVTKAEATLQNYEDKTGYMARERQLQRVMQDIRGAAQRLMTLGGESQAMGQTILCALQSVSVNAGKEMDHGI